MTRAHLSDRALRLLAAYVDGELPPKERAEVARRVAQDPTWQAAYQAMRSAKMALAALPPAPRPRAFTLTRAEAWPQPRRSRGQWWYRLASVMVALLLVIWVAGDWLTSPRLAAAPPPAMLAAEPAASNDTAAAAPAQADAQPEKRGQRPGVETAPLAPQAATATATPMPTPTPAPTPAPAPPPLPFSAHALLQALLLALALALGWLGWRRRPQK